MDDREKMKAIIEDWSYKDKEKSVSYSLADHLIANGVVARKKVERVRHYSGVYGYEGEIGEYPNGWECPFCGCDEIRNFCPDCGADLRGERDA